MSDLAITGAPDLLQCQFDTQIATTLTVVENGHRPGRRDLVLIVSRMVVKALLDQLLHRRNLAPITYMPHYGSDHSTARFGRPAASAWDHQDMEPLAAPHHVALTVSDLDRSAAWYADALGLIELFREESPTRRAIVFRLPNGTHAAVGLVEHVGAGSRAFDPTVTGLDHFALTVSSQDGMRQWVDHLDAHHIDHSGIIEVPPGQILNFKDPDGIALSLFWDRSD